MTKAILHKVRLRFNLKQEKQKEYIMSATRTRTYYHNDVISVVSEVTLLQYVDVIAQARNNFKYEMGSNKGCFHRIKAVILTSCSLLADALAVLVLWDSLDLLFKAKTAACWANCCKMPFAVLLLLQPLLFDSVDGSADCFWPLPNFLLVQLSVDLFFRWL